MKKSISIKEARKRAGLTQIQMAEMFEIPRRTLEDWERGKHTPPKYLSDSLIERLDSMIMESDTASSDTACSDTASSDATSSDTTMVFSLDDPRLDEILFGGLSADKGHDTKGDFRVIRGSVADLEIFDELFGLADRHEDKAEVSSTEDAATIEAKARSRERAKERRRERREREASEKEMDAKLRDYYGFTSSVRYTRAELIALYEQDMSHKSAVADESPTSVSMLEIKRSSEFGFALSAEESESFLSLIRSGAAILYSETRDLSDSKIRHRVYVSGNLKVYIKCHMDWAVEGAEALRKARKRLYEFDCEFGYD